MQYTLCFPYGEPSWEHNTIKLNLNPLEDIKVENIIQPNIVTSDLSDELVDFIILQDQNWPDNDESNGENSDNIKKEKRN